MAHLRLRYHRCCRCGDRFLAQSPWDLTCSKCSRPPQLIDPPLLREGDFLIADDGELDGGAR